MPQVNQSVGRLHVVGDEPLGSPEVEVFESMLDGWRAQRLSRNLAFSTVESGARVIRRFSDDVGSYPWHWSPGDLEAWMSNLRTRGVLARSTVRNYGLTIGAFLTYACDPAYGWNEVCLGRFGSHPTQICTAANLATHKIDNEARPQRRPLTRDECQLLFDAADERADAVRHKSAKGWAPAFRDATMLKAAYAWGLRRRELLMLERCDFGPNPKAPEFGAVRVPGALWEGFQRVTTKAPGGAYGDGVVERCHRRVGRRGASLLAPRLFGAVAVRTAPTDERRPAEHDLCRLCGPCRIASWFEPALPTALLRHPSHRRRFRPAVRPTTSRASP
jgi:hypothetical protein